MTCHGAAARKQNTRNLIGDTLPFLFIIKQAKFVVFLLCGLSSLFIALAALRIAEHHLQMIRNCDPCKEGSKHINRVACFWILSLETHSRTRHNSSSTLSLLSLQLTFVFSFLFRPFFLPYLRHILLLFLFSTRLNTKLTKNSIHISCSPIIYLMFELEKVGI